jgi:NAD(P)-dependent dehydrogenase (short-subunit alcohol dehydrogenase family)
MGERMSGKLEERVAVVTGSSGGIGAGIATLFAEEGAKVVIHGRNPDAMRRVINTCVDNGVARDRLSGFSADLAAPDDCRALIAHAVEHFGGVDILVNNAGDTRRGFLDDTTLEQWDHQMAVNLRAPFLLTQAVVPSMRERGGGAIVNVGSVNAYIGQGKLLAYSASKGGLMTFSRNAAAQLNRYRIRVNVLNVGWTLTEGERKVMRADTGRDDWLDAALQTRPFGRMLMPRDIGLAALYFASDDGALVTGSVLDIEQYPITAPPL